MRSPLRYRDLPLAEISDLYPSYPVHDNDTAYTLQPSDPSDGPIILEIPKTHPVDAHNRPIDLTYSIPIPDDLLLNVLNTKFSDPIQARIGRFVPVSSAAPASVQHSGKLILHDPDPNAIELILRRQLPLSFNNWGKIDPPEFSLRVQPHVIAQSHYSASWGFHADFWIIECAPALDALSAYCAAKFDEFLRDASV